MQAADAPQVVVITGANEGIGYHTLTSLLDDGYRVVGLDIASENLQELQDEHPERVRFYECDVALDDHVETAIQAIFDEWGHVDILVNNAAVLDFGFFEDQSLADTKRTFEVNYFGYLRTIRAVLPHMRERGSGIIHNVSSGVGRVGNPGLTGYAATKGAIEAFTRSLRLELQHENVSCTVMHPRLARTRSAAVLGFPDSQQKDPAYVGRKLADEIQSTDPVIYTDWVTKIGLWFAERFPIIVRKGTQRFLEAHEAESGRDT